MNYSEKAEMIERFRNEAGGVVDMLLIAYENDDKKAISKFSQKVKEAYSPIVKMYATELNRAINPTHTSTVPIVIMLLRQTADGIAKHNPEAAKAADIFDKMFGSEVLEIKR